MLKRLFANADGSIKPWVTYAFIAVAVIVGGYFVYAAWTGGDTPMKGNWLCMHCSYSANKAPEVGEDIPALCPKCGKQGFAPAYACPKCKTPLVLNTYRNLPEPTKCSKCRQEVRYGQ